MQQNFWPISELSGRGAERLSAQLGETGETGDSLPQLLCHSIWCEMIQVPALNGNETRAQSFITLEDVHYLGDHLVSFRVDEESRLSHSEGCGCSPIGNHWHIKAHRFQ